jgi:hypothetical protein
VSGTVDYLRIAEDEPLPDLGAFGPFRAVVVIEADYSPEWQELVSKWLVAGGCLYMLAWGKDCATWDDSVDYANIEAFDSGDIPADQFVYTTWHENQPLDEVLWFAQFAAKHPEVELDETLIVHISEKNARNALLARALAARDSS